jgi:hypothetical protein
MKRRPLHTTAHYLRAGLVLALACVFVSILPARSSAAAGIVRYTITVPTVLLRDQPSIIASNTYTVYKGEFYTVTGRTDDGLWVELAAVTEKDAGTWMLADLGVVTQGKLKDVPVVSTLDVYHPYHRRLYYPDWIPTITAAQKAIYRGSVDYAKDLHMFTVVGDCNSLPPVYLQRVADGLFDVTDYTGLGWVADRFTPSFSRVSLAVNGGFNAAAMSDSDWADHALCDKNVGPFACEVWVSRASVIFIEVGTGDQYEWKDFEKNYRPLVQHALKKGVLPVLVTKADDLEARNGAPSGYINDVIRKLADEYSVPLLDFWQATRTLPNNGLIDEGGLNFHLSQAGQNLHLVATLQTLDAISR